MEETAVTSEVPSVVHVLLTEGDTGVSMKYCVMMIVGVLMVKRVLKHWPTSMALCVTQPQPVKH